MAKRGRPPKIQMNAEQLLYQEQVECLGEAKKIRHLLMEQVKALIAQIDGPDVKTDTRMEILAGLAEIHAKLIKATETVGKYVRDGAGRGEEEETSLEELLKA